MDITPTAALPLPFAAHSLNQDCFCIRLDRRALARALRSELHQPDLAELLHERCPHMFSAYPTFVSTTHLARMRQLIAAIESVVALPAWRERVLSEAPAIARQDPGGATGVFFGYDFHVNAAGIGLIEINSNAGGALLNAVLVRAQRACCPAVADSLPPLASAEAMEAGILAMFGQEWARSGRDRPLRRIALVDSAPAQQYLYPDFLLFQRLFEGHGIQVVIADPAELGLRDGRLYHGALEINLVYNRLTDFYLEQADNAVLREAWLQQAVVLTPHPQAHALYADKGNLALLTDAAWLQSAGVAQATLDLLLAGIPHTERVRPANAERLWSERGQLFFKPVAGFGSRAAYRGSKLTRRVWQEILAGDYVAQALVLPGTRVVSAQPSGEILKFDVRAYVYDGHVQSFAARLYQGQTTNFRTPGGGFAPVYAAVAGGCGEQDRQAKLLS